MKISLFMRSGMRTSAIWIVAVGMCAILFGFQGRALAYHEDCFLRLFGSGCHTHDDPPPPPPPPPSIRIVCDGVVPSSWSGKKACTDPAHLERWSAFTIVGSNLSPAARLLTVEIFDGDKYLNGLAWSAYPLNEVLYVGSAGDLTLRAETPPVAVDQAHTVYDLNNTPLIKPGTYRLQVKVGLGNFQYQYVSTNITIIDSPTRVPPPTTPPPTTPPPPVNKPTPPEASKKPDPPPAKVETPRPVPKIEFQKARTISIGGTVSLHGTGFTPGVELRSLRFQNVAGTERSIPARNATVGANGTFDAVFDVTTILADLLKSPEGDIRAVLLEMSDYYYNLKIAPPEPFHLVNDCPPVGAQLTIRPAAADLSSAGYLQAVGKGYACFDPVEIIVKPIGADVKLPFTTDKDPGWKTSYFDQNGEVIYTSMWGPDAGDAVDPTVREIEITLRDKHGNEQTGKVPALHKYGLTFDPPRAKPGEEVRIVGWRGYNKNTRISLTFDKQKLKSVYLDPNDLPTFEIPQTATNGIHTITTTSGWFGLGAKAIINFEVYGAGEAEAATLSVTPKIAVSGDALSVAGEHWTEDNVSLLLFDPNDKEVRLSAVQDLCPRTLGKRGCAAGERKYSVTLPKNLVRGTYSMILTGEAERAGDSFEIRAPDATKKGIFISLDPTSGVAGSVVGVRGGGFPAKSGVIGYFDKEKLRIGKGFGLDADATGSFAAVVAIPHDATPGKHPITFKTGTSFEASAVFTVLGAGTDEEKKAEDIKESPEETSKGEGQKRTEGEATRKYGDTDATQYTDQKTGSYGELPGQSYGGVETKGYGGVETKAYGGVEQNAYGSVEQKAYGGVETKTYQGVETRQFKDVEAPQFKAPATTPEGCNVLVPMYMQPERCRTTSMSEPAVFVAAIGSLFSSLSPWSQVSAAVASKKKASAKTPKPLFTPQQLAGEYRCRSYNASGAGGSCRLAPPLSLSAKGTYTMSSEKGTFKVVGDTVVLSQSKIRGAGKIIEKGSQIVFEYTYKGWNYRVVYGRPEVADASLPATNTPKATQSTPAATPAPTAMTIDLIVVYPGTDDYSDWVSTIAAIPAGEKEGPEGLARAYAKQKSIVTFRALPLGKIYTIVVSTGLARWEVGKIDLTSAPASAEIVLNAIY